MTATISGGILEVQIGRLGRMIQCDLMASLCFQSWPFTTK